MTARSGGTTSRMTARTFGSAATPRTLAGTPRITPRVPPVPIPGKAKPPPPGTARAAWNGVIDGAHWEKMGREGVGRWLVSVGLGAHAGRFQQQRVDGLGLRGLRRMYVKGQFVPFQMLANSLGVAMVGELLRLGERLRMMPATPAQYFYQTNGGGGGDDGGGDESDSDSD